MNKVKIGWLEKLLLRFWPTLAMKRFAREMGIENPPFGKAHDLFAGVERIDIIPFKSGYRGFILVLDGKTALYFYQDGDHFVYDGYEMGKYDKGEVTLFDHLRGE